MMTKQGKSHPPKLTINTTTESGQAHQFPSLGMASFNFGRRVMGKYGFPRRMNPLQPLTFLNNFRKKERNHDYPEDRRFMFADYYNIHITLNHLTTTIPALVGSPLIQAGMENSNSPIQLFNHYEPTQIINRQLILNRLTQLIRSGAIAPGPAIYNQNLSLVKYLAVLQHQNHISGVPDRSIDSEQPDIHQRPGSGNSLVYRLMMVYQLAGSKIGHYPGTYQDLKKGIAPQGDSIHIQQLMDNHQLLVSHRFSGGIIRTANEGTRTSVLQLPATRYLPTFTGDLRNSAEGSVPGVQSAIFPLASFCLPDRGMYVPLTGRQSSLILQNLMKASHPDWAVSGVSNVSFYGYNGGVAANPMEYRGSLGHKYNTGYPRLRFGNLVRGHPVPDRFAILIRETESIGRNDQDSGKIINRKPLEKQEDPIQNDDRWENDTAGPIIRLLTQRTQPSTQARLLKTGLTSGGIPVNGGTDDSFTLVQQPGPSRGLTTPVEESASPAKMVAEQTAGEIVARMGQEMADKKGHPVHGTPPEEQLESNTGIETVQSQMELFWKGVQRRDRTLYHIFRKYENPAESSGPVNRLQLGQSHSALKLRTVAGWQGLERLPGAGEQPLETLENHGIQRMPEIRRSPADKLNPLTATQPNLTFKIQRKPVPDQEPESETKRPPKVDEAVMTSQITEKVTQNLARELAGSQLNIIANKVYQIIEKRLTIEKDRRGIKG